jgi:hypothetical protein
MKKKTLFCLVCVLAAVALLISSCDSGGGEGGGLISTVQVVPVGAQSSAPPQSPEAAESPSGAPAKASPFDGKKVELYLTRFMYFHDTSPKTIILVANSDGFDINGLPIDNDGWFSIDEEEWVNMSDWAPGRYSAVKIKITALRVGGEDGTTYKFGEWGGDSQFGESPNPQLLQNLPDSKDNFLPMIMPENAVGFKTILTVDPAIVKFFETTDGDHDGVLNGVSNGVLDELDTPPTVPKPSGSGNFLSARDCITVDGIPR